MKTGKRTFRFCCPDMGQNVDNQIVQHPDMNLKGMWIYLKDTPIPKGTILNYCMHCGTALMEDSDTF